MICRVLSWYTCRHKLSTGHVRSLDTALLLLSTSNCFVRVCLCDFSTSFVQSSVVIPSFAAPWPLFAQKMFLCFVRHLFICIAGPVWRVLGLRCCDIIVSVACRPSKHRLFSTWAVLLFIRSLQGFCLLICSLSLVMLKQIWNHSTKLCFVRLYQWLAEKAEWVFCFIQEIGWEDCLL